MGKTEKIVLIKQRIQAAQDQQKSYANLKRKPMEFKVGDRVMLKVSPWKGVVRFIKRGKLNPRVHPTFHVSNLKKCYADEPLAMPLEGVHIDDKLHFVEEPEEVLSSPVHPPWEREDSFKKKYPHLFKNRASSSTTRKRIFKKRSKKKAKNKQFQARSRKGQIAPVDRADPDDPSPRPTRRPRHDDPYVMVRDGRVNSLESSIFSGTSPWTNADPFLPSSKLSTYLSNIAL
ncbi:hypothetical protein Tco_0534521 [Tanacetum coccineum]